MQLRLRSTRWSACFYCVRPVRRHRRRDSAASSKPAGCFRRYPGLFRGLRGCADSAACFGGREIEGIFAIARDWLNSLEWDVRHLLSLEERALSTAESDPRLLAELLELGSLALNGRGSRQLQSASWLPRLAWIPSGRRSLGTTGASTSLTAKPIELDALRHAFELLGSAPGCDRCRRPPGRCKDAVSTVGNHFAQPLRPRRSDGTLKRNWLPSVNRSRQVSVFATFESWIRAMPPCGLSPMLAPRFRPTSMRLVYPRPGGWGDLRRPALHSDHYSRFYHVLETIAAG